MSVVVDQLQGRRPVELTPHDYSDLDPLLNLWRRGLRKDELYAGFKDALTHEDPKVRAGAVMFFARMRTEQDDLDLLHGLLATKTELFEGVPEPWFGGADDLRSMLASAVASRAVKGHPSVETLKEEALEPGRAGGVIVGLVGLDPVWVRTHAGAIVNGTPSALDPLLFNLQMRGINPVAFLAELKSEVDPEVLKAGIRSALGARAAEVEAAVFGS
jgi:hypothetical protein